MTDESSLEQRIRERAYRIWLAEGQTYGRDKAHWQAARAAVLAEEDAQQKQAADEKTQHEREAAAQDSRPEREAAAEQRRKGIAADERRKQREPRAACEPPPLFASLFAFWPWGRWR